jgi:hypothetical protein
MPLSPLNYQNISTWFNNHVELGGSVYRSELTWDFLPSPEDDINNLFDKVKNVDFEDVLAFQEADVIDNNMPYREILEDSSKIFYLHQQIKQDNLIFNPQIIHEPWHSRYRIHPGSGRLAALWLANKKTVTCLYTHFNEPMFQLPPNSNKIHNIEGIFDCILSTDEKVEMSIETYEAFPTSENEKAHTLTRDSEWDWNNIETTREWQFLRYSEGRNFLEYKSNWRSDIVSVWEALQEVSFTEDLHNFMMSIKYN